MIRIDCNHQAISIWVILSVVLFSCSENKKPPVKTQGDASLLVPQTALEKEDFAFVPIEGDTSIYGPTAITRGILQDRNGNVWFGGGSGLWIYKDQSFEQYADNFVGYLYEDSKGQIWTSYAKTTRYWVLSKYDEQVPFANNKTPEEIDLGEQMLFGILEDQNENIWFGHLEGIGRYNGTSFDYFKAPDQLPNN